MSDVEMEEPTSPLLKRPIPKMGESGALVVRLQNRSIIKDNPVRGKFDQDSKIPTGPFIGRKYKKRPRWCSELTRDMWCPKRDKYIFQTYPEETNLRWDDVSIPLYQTPASWKNPDALMKRTVPREMYKSEAELKDLSDEELRHYKATWSYWQYLWFVQSYRHYVEMCRVAETPSGWSGNKFWKAPPLSMPIRINVLDFNWDKWIRDHQVASGGYKFDVIVTDPPWTLATEKATRGVALNYDQINDKRLMGAVPFIDLLNDRGVIFMWVINAKMKWAVKFLKDQGFTLVTICSWVKMSTNRLVARGHGYYLQHGKEDCIIAVKGSLADATEYNWEVIHGAFGAEKRCQSQKPTYFYDMVEAFAPHGFYLEVFARRNNLRNGWVTIGNQL